jgi:hypothetical protein
MASTNIATDFKNALIRLSSPDFNEKNEKRMPNFGALKAVMDDTTSLVAPSVIENAKKSVRQDVEIALLKKYTPGNVDNDSCTFEGETSETAIVTPSYSRYGFAVKAYPEIHYGNAITMQETMANDMFQNWKKQFNRLDTAAVALLDASKHALTGITSTYFDIASSTANLKTGLDPQKIYAYMPAFLKKMELEGTYKEVANTEALTTTLLSRGFGVSNSENKMGFMGSLAGSDNFNTYTSNNVNVPATFEETRYVFENGTFGMLNWNRPIGTADWGRIGEHEYWTQIQDPFMGLTWTVHYKKACTDLSTDYEGLTATIGEHYLIYTDVAFLEAYSSDTTQSCVKFGVNI